MSAIAGAQSLLRSRARNPTQKRMVEVGKLLSGFLVHAEASRGVVASRQLLTFLKRPETYHGMFLRLWRVSGSPFLSVEPAKFSESGPSLNIAVWLEPVGPAPLVGRPRSR